MRPWRRGLKRLFDLALAAAGLLLFALPMAWIGWRTRCELGPPVLFRQARIGTGGKPFDILKFRTMDPQGRVTPFAQQLRRTAMDELPQLINILAGQMSFVGPRPLIPEELREMDHVPDGRRRFSVRPGLTGLAQVRSEKVPTLPERLRWDLAYVRDCSLRLDLQILFTSVGVSARGAWEKPNAHAA